MFKTDEEYFADTSHISSSMIKAYLRSPAYYRALYIDKVIDGPDSAAIDFGSALDCLLTESITEFNKQFAPAALKKDNPEQFEFNKTFSGTVLSAKAYETVMAASNAVQATSAYKWIVANNPVSQTVLTGKINGIKVKGKLDWLNVVGKTAYISDLKTTTNLHPTKYLYHSADFQYDVQLAMYRELVMQNFEVDEVVCQHLVVTKNDYPQTAAFIFSEALLSYGGRKILKALEGIQMKDFKEPDVTWEGAYVLEYNNQGYLDDKE